MQTSPTDRRTRSFKGEPHESIKVVEAFHEHAFSAVTLWPKGAVREHHLDGHIKEFYAGQWKRTPRTTFHKIEAIETTWALSVRGPWVNRWREWRNNCFITLTPGRKQL